MRKLRLILFFAVLALLLTSCELEPQFVVTNSKGAAETLKSEGKVLRLIADWKKDTSVCYISVTKDYEPYYHWKRGQ